MSADSVFSREDLVVASHLAILDQDLTGFEATEEGVDLTLEYVVEWLHQRGSQEVADALNLIAFNR